MSIRQRYTSWLSLSLLAAVAAALAALAVAVVPVGAASHTVAVSTTLSGASEVPPVESPYGGSFSATINLDTYEISYTLQSDAQGITKSHLHAGAAGVNGGPAVFVIGSADPGEDGVDVSGTITEADLVGALEGDAPGLVEAMLAGDTYINLHTEANPDGELRGQIAPAVVVGGLPAAGSGGLADVGGGASIAAGVLAALSVLMLGAGVRLAVRRRA